MHAQLSTMTVTRKSRLYRHFSTPPDSSPPPNSPGMCSAAQRSHALRQPQTSAPRSPDPAGISRRAAADAARATRGSTCRYAPSRDAVGVAPPHRRAVSTTRDAERGAVEPRAAAAENWSWHCVMTCRRAAAAENWSWHCVTMCR